MHDAMPDRRTVGSVLMRQASALVIVGSLLAMGLIEAVQAQPADPADYLRQMDSDGDGRVSQAEYLRWMVYAFQRLDRNGDGVLEAEELPGGRGGPITLAAHRQVLEQRFERQDRNGDGWLDAAELAAPPR